MKNSVVVLCRVFFGLVVLATLQATPLVAAGSNVQTFLGVSLAGPEFGSKATARGFEYDEAEPDAFGSTYIYPGDEQLAYLRSKGLTLVRLPLRWERVQPVLNEPLNVAEAARIDQFLNNAARHDMRVILDIHNYGRFRGNIIGSAAVPNEAFKNLWTRLAARYKLAPALFGYGLNNEPYDMQGHWPAAAQAGVDGIRAWDTWHAILVAGDCWSSAHRWRDSACNEDLSVTDFSNNVYYEAHVFFDSDHTGTYQGSDDNINNPNIGIERVKPFHDWLTEKGFRGIIGEVGVPDDDAKWLTALERFLTYLQQNDIGAIYWAAGPWWPVDYRLSVEPHKTGAEIGLDRPQMAVLQRVLALGQPALPRHITRHRVCDHQQKKCFYHSRQRRWFW